MRLNNKQVSPQKQFGWIRFLKYLCIGVFITSLGLISAHAVPPKLGGFGRLVPVKGTPSPELVCNLPLRWVQEDVNRGFSMNGFLVTENRVYSSSFGVHAQDRKTGERLWDFTFKADPKNNAQVGRGISVLKEDGDKLYFASFGGILFALNKHTGEELWRFELSREIERGLTFDDENIYLSDVNTLYAVNKNTGTLSWRKLPPQGGNIPDGFREPLLKEGRLFAQTYTVLFGLEAKTGKELWVYKPKREEFPGFSHSTFPKLYQDVILVTQEEKTLLTAIDMRTGLVRWQMQPAPVNLETAAITTPEGELLISSKHEMALFDVNTKEAHWWFGTGYSYSQYREPVLYKDLILWGSASDYLFALNRFTGKEVFRFPYGDLTGGISALDVRDDVVYLLGFDGGVYAFDLTCPQLDETAQ